MDKEFYEDMEVVATIDLSGYSYKNRNIYRYLKSDIFKLVSKFKNIKDYKKIDDKAEVFYENDEKLIKVIYKYKSSDEIIEDIEKNKTIDLSFHFIERADLSIIANKQINNITAFFSIWFGDVCFNNIEFSGLIDFSFCKFYSNVSFERTIYRGCDVKFEKVLFLKNSEATNNVAFTHAEFNDTKITFEGSIFEVDTSFRKSRFGDGDICFSECTFEGDSLDMDHTDFGNGLKNFSDTKIFTSNILIWKSKFGTGEILFNRVECLGSIVFSETVFNMDKFSAIKSSFESYLNFDECKFLGGEIEIRDSIFKNSSLSFAQCDLGETKINLNNSVFKEVIFIDITFEKDLLLRVEEITKLILQNCYIKADVFMDMTYDRDAYILGGILHDPKNNKYIEYTYLSFENTKVTGNIYLDWERNNVCKAIDDYSEIRWIQWTLKRQDYLSMDRMLQYRMLKNNFNKIGQYEDEDKALVKFMDNNLMLSKSKGAKFVKYFFSRVGGYGTNPFTIACAIFVIIIGFAFAYMCVGIDSNLSDNSNNDENISSNANTCSISDSSNYTISNNLVDTNTDNKNQSNEKQIPFVRELYFSGITFLTIGYGDISPENDIARILAVLEGFLGVFTMSYFSVAVIRRILR